MSRGSALVRVSNIRIQRDRRGGGDVNATQTSQLLMRLNGAGGKARGAHATRLRHGPATQDHEPPCWCQGTRPALDRARRGPRAAATSERRGQWRLRCGRAFLNHVTWGTDRDVSAVS